jgi:cyclopropane fatty-acyl-phospholipid synthase-like methyltransferase
MNDVDNTVGIFDKYAKQYQDKYMAHGPYVETYSYLAGLVKEGSSVLDVGCGPANISKFLSDCIAALTIHGCDLSPQMINLAKQNLPNGHFELRDSRDLKSILAKYDVVISGFCFPYLTDTEVREFISETQAHLNAGGLFYLSTMEGKYSDSGYPDENAVERLYTYYHQEEFLVECLKNADFEILKVKRSPFMENGATTATDLFIYARATKLTRGET